MTLLIRSRIDPRPLDRAPTDAATTSRAGRSATTSTRTPPPAWPRGDRLDADNDGGRCDSRPRRVVLGLVTTKRGELESKDGLKRLLEEAARCAPLDQVCLSPQFGFSSTVEGNALSYDEQ